jgi:hypothetical protein
VIDIAEGRRKKEVRKKGEARSKKEEAITSRVRGIKNVLTVEVAISREARISGCL